MSRQICMGLVVVVLLSVCLMVGGKTGSTQSQTKDPGCGGSPNTDLDEYLERCGAPKCDTSLAGIYYEEDTEGNCIRVVQFCDDEGNARTVIRPCKKRVLPLPNIAVIIVSKSTLRVDVARPNKKEKPHTLQPDQLKLVDLVRAMARSAELPSEDLLQVPQDFWANQQRLVLKKKAKT